MMRPRKKFAAQATKNPPGIFTTRLQKVEEKHHNVHDNLKTLKQQAAAEKIQHAYQNYKKRKNKLVQKKHLLPKQGTPAKGIPKTDQEQVSFLFENVDIDTRTTMFRKAGLSTLFPLSKKEKLFSVNMKLLEHYINHSQDVRQWTLEAYLKKWINSDQLITLYYYQQMVNEFWQSGKHGSKIQLFPVSDEKKLTNDTEKYLLETLLDSAPYYIRSNPTRKDGFFNKLAIELKKLRHADNHFAVMEIPDHAAYRIVFYNLMNLNKLNFKKPNMLVKSFLTSKENRLFFLEILRKLKIPGDLSRPETIFNELCHQLFYHVTKKDFVIEEKINYLYNDKETLSQYLQLTGTFYADLITNNQKFGSHVFMPKFFEGRDHFALVLYGSEIQNAVHSAVSDFDPSLFTGPKNTVKKLPSFGDIPVSRFHESAKEGAWIIGLDHPGFTLQSETHGFRTQAGSYTAHDLHLHQEFIFYMTLYASPIYKLRLIFAESLAKLTKHQVSDTINELLELDEPFFTQQFDGELYHQHVVSELAFYKSNSRLEFYEYSLLLACDILKNPNDYCEHLKRIKIYKNLSDDGLMFELTDIVLAYGKSLPDFIEPENLKYLIKWPHDVDVFVLLAIDQYKMNSNEYVNLGENLNFLLKNKAIEFKWNANDGIMLNIDEYSFRFRNATSSMDTLRLSRTYKYDGKIRVNSCEPRSQALLHDLLKRKLAEFQAKTSTQNKPGQR